MQPAPHGLLIVSLSGSLLVLALLAGCGGGPEAEEPAAAREPPDERDEPTAAPETPDERDEPTAAPETPDERDAPAAETSAEPVVTRCGIADTTRQQRSACADDHDCALRAIDYATCLEDGCGFATHAYNCGFAARVTEECRRSDCELGLGGLGSARDVRCGGGGRATMRAECVDGFCEARVAPSSVQSRLLRVTGAIAEREVRVAMRRELRTIEACFPAEGEDEPVVLRLDVSAAGAVTRTTVTVGADGDASVIRCVRAAAAAAALPRSSDGAPVQVLHRFARPRVRSCESGI